MFSCLYFNSRVYFYYHTNTSFNKIILHQLLGDNKYILFYVQLWTLQHSNHFCLYAYVQLIVSSFLI